MLLTTATKPCMAREFAVKWQKYSESGRSRWSTSPCTQVKNSPNQQTTEIVDLKTETELGVEKAQTQLI